MRARLFALGFAVAILFPVAAHFTIYMFSPPPKEEDYGLGTYSYQVESQSGTKEERLAKAKEEDQKQKAFDAANKREARTLFYGIYPIALAALIVGTFLRAAAVGTGLIFAGILCLADSCYSSWDIVPGWVSLGSVILATLIVLVIGIAYERRAVNTTTQ